MAKNKIFLTVLLALLAGCAVLIGCTGEGAGSVPKSVDNNMSKAETEIQWEPKQYWTGTIDEDFDGYSVLVVMDKNIGGPNKVHDKSFFGGIEIESIRDLTWFTGSYDNLGINWEIWRQLLCLKLPGDSKENVVRAIRHLEKIDGIISAEPNGMEWPTFIIEDDKGKDEEKSPYSPPFPPPKPQELGTFPGLDVETERQLKLDFAHWRSLDTADYVRILNYFGNYNGCELVRMEGLADVAVVTKVSVAGMVFAFPNPDVTLVWKRGENPASGPFYRLNEAYDLGALTLEDIKNLHKQYYEIFPFMMDYAKEDLSLPMPD